MRVTRTGWCWTSVGLFLLAAAGPARAVDQAALDALKQLFETDPATAFVKAEARLGALKASDDAKEVSALVQLTAEQAARYSYCVSLERMGAIAVAGFTQTGDWSALAEVYAQRATAGMLTYAYMNDHPLNRWSRCLWLLEQAVDHYAKAGKPTPEVGPRLLAVLGDQPREKVGVTSGSLDLRGFVRLAKDCSWHSDADTWSKIIGGLPLEYQAAIGTAAEAQRTGDDARAISAALPALQAAANDPTLPPGKRADLVAMYVQLVPLPGGDALLPPLHTIVASLCETGAAGRSLADLACYCWQAWGGNRDAYMDEAMWCLEQLRVCHRDLFLPNVALPAQKVARFGSSSLAQRIVATCLEIGRELEPSDHRTWAMACPRAAFPGLEPSLQRELMQTGFDELVQSGDARWPGTHPLQSLSSFPDASPADREEFALLWSGWLLDIAGRYDRPADQQRVVGDAAALLEAVGQVEAAARVRDLLVSLSGGDPNVLLQVVLKSAQPQAAAGKWGEAAKALESAVAGAPDSVELLQAALLLDEACLRLGKPAEAEKWMAKAKGLVDTLPLPAGEKADYLVSLAGLCELAAQVAERGIQQ